MKTYIRITSCSLDDHWYSSKIGNVYKVKKGVWKTDPNYYDLGTKDGKLVLIQDCQPVNLIIGSKVKVKKYKGQDLYGVPEAEYRMLVGKELTVDYISEDSMLCRVDNMAYIIHESLVKPV